MSKTGIKEDAVRTIRRSLEEAAFIFTDNLESGGKPALESWNPEGFTLSFSGAPSG